MSSKIKALFGQIQNIPQIPEVIRVLISQFNDPDVDLKAIARNVEKEQLIALKVLRLVNSAYFGLPKKIDSIEEAVVLLGMVRLRSLIIASGIVSSIPVIEGFNIKLFWLDGFRTASYAKWLASKSACDEDIAFTAGLLNNLGTILIYLGQRDEAVKIEQLIAEGHERLFVEKMRLGFSSQDVSAELCGLWQFSEELIVPIAQCAEPLLADSVSKLACVLNIAKYLSACKQGCKDNDEILQGLSLDISSELGLSATFFDENIGEILGLESELEGMLV